MQQVHKKIKGGNTDIESNRIAVIIKPNKLQFLPHKYEMLGPDEVLVKMVGCGLDHTDIDLWEGRDWIKYPLPSGVPGREGWGVIEKAGEHTSFKDGEVVAVFTSNALSTHTICKHDEVHRLPDNFKNKNFPAKAFAYAVNIFENIDIKKDDVVVILGNGFVSTIITSLIKKRGAKALKMAYAAKRNEEPAVFHWGEKDKLVEKVEELTNTKGCDMVIECTGTKASCDFATSLLKEEGTLILTRKVKDKSIKINMSDPCDLSIVLGHDQTLNDLHEGTEKAVEMINSGTLDPDSFISKVYSFNELEAALNELRSDSGECCKLCIRFDI